MEKINQIKIKKDFFDTNMPGLFTFGDVFERTKK